MKSLAVISSSYSQVLWQAQLFKRLAGAVSLPTVLATTAIAGAHFAQIFAFIIPLKVILMLGSDTVPRFFQGFMTVETRELWIATLAALAVIFYALSILLVTVSNRCLVKGAQQLMQQRKVAGNLSKDERKQLRRHYASLCSSHADVLFVVLASLAMAILNPLISLILALIILVEMILTGWLIATESGGLFQWLRNGIRNNYDSYLQYLGAINFLSLFLLLIADYVIGSGQSAIIAILTLLLGRQMFGTMVRFSKKAVRLRRQKRAVEDLLMPGQYDLDEEDSPLDAFIRNDSNVQNR